MNLLWIAMISFVVSHLILPMDQIRSPLTKILGELGYLALYSIISVAAFAWAINAFIAAPYVEIFIPSVGMRHASLSLMLIAAFLIVSGYLSKNPGTVQATKLGWRPEAHGVFKITRHPVMWGVALWGVSHVLANGHLAALILFGGLAGLSLAGAAHIDLRKRKSLGDEWRTFESETSFVPLVAIAMGRIRLERGEIPWWQTLLTVGVYIGMLAVHAFAGRDVFPVGFF